MTPDWLRDALRPLLRGYQLEWLTADGDDVCHIGGRQIGKDWSWALEVALDLAFRSGRQWSMISASKSHSQDFLGDVKRHLRYLDRVARAHGPALPLAVKDNSEGIELDNGSRIRAFGATKKNATGRRGNVILNEVGIMPHAQEIYEAAEPVVRGQRSQGVEARFILISNAAVRGSFLHRFWTSEQSQGFRKILTTWEDAYRRWLTQDRGRPLAAVDAWIGRQVQEMIRRLGGGAFGQWYRCLWRSPDEGYLHYELLDRMAFDPDEGEGPDIHDRQIPQVIGYDVGRHVNPAALARLLLWGQDDEGLWRRWGLPVEVFRQMPYAAQRDEVERLRLQRKTVKIAIDKTGIGDEPAEAAQERWPGLVEPIHQGAPVVWGVWSAFKADGEAGLLRYHRGDKELRMELDGVSARHLPGGRVQVLLPAEGGAHGDRASALALANYAAREGVSADYDTSKVARNAPPRVTAAQIRQSLRSIGRGGF